MITFVQVLDFIGTFAFAISGIRLASAKQFDWFGGLCSRNGNGYRRRYNSRCIVGCDAGMDDRPHLFDMYGACIVLGDCFLGKVSDFNMHNTFFLFDSIGLALFTVVGVGKSIALGYPYWVAIIMGSIDGCCRRCNPRCVY